MYVYLYTHKVCIYIHTELLIQDAIRGVTQSRATKKEDNRYSRKKSERLVLHHSEKEHLSLPADPSNSCLCLSTGGHGEYALPAERLDLDSRRGTD